MPPRLGDLPRRRPARLRYIFRVSPLAKAAAVVLASLSVVTVAVPRARSEPRVLRTSGLASKKGAPVDALEDPALLATLAQVHTGERLVLDSQSPPQEVFDAFVADRVTGEHHPLDPRLLGLLRSIAGNHAGCRIELVSGYRSPKLNEMLRKKGHHVASHSQHSLGHACDFRVVPPGQDAPLDPRAIEREIRALGWEGGVGVYPTTADWVVHADVGANRRWVN
jgi:uncharacterized protein YcbK (DUF882 family)